MSRVVCFFCISFYLILFSVFPAVAQYAYEPFDYAVGDIGGNSGGEGWTGGWTANTNFTVVNPVVPLVYSNEAAGIVVHGSTNALRFTGGSGIAEAISRNASNLAQDVYFSVLMNFENWGFSFNKHFTIGDDNGANESGMIIGRYGSDNTDDLGGAVAMGTAAEYDTQPTIGQTYLFVSKLVWNETDGAFDSVETWVNPTNSTLEQAEYHLAVTNADAADMLPGGISAWSIFTESQFVAGDTFVIDELRIGATWNSVVRSTGIDTEIMISTDAVVITEGSTNGFQVKLNKAPEAPTTVTVSRASGDTDISVTDGSNLVFNAANWDTWQNVELTAAEDADETHGAAVVQCAAVNLDSVSLSVTEVDNDDSILPTVESVSAPDALTVVLIFSEPLDPVTAQTATNYVITNGNAVTSAVLGGDGMTVTLTIAAMENGSYAIVVNNVEDLMGNAVAADTTLAYDYSSLWISTRGDEDRTGYTTAALSLPLSLAWSHQPNHPPNPAYVDSIIEGSPDSTRKQGRAEGLTYDWCFYPVLANGKLFFASSSEEAVICLDAADGSEEWIYFTDGPVRFAPYLTDDKVYFGSEDGMLYCLNQSDGSLVWKADGAPGTHHAIGHHRPMSAWPVRGAPVVDDNTVYFGTGVYPEQGSYLNAVNASTGANVYQRSVPYPLHGQLYLTTWPGSGEERIWGSTGRMSPTEYVRSTGIEKITGADVPKQRGGGNADVFTVGNFPAWGPDESGAIVFRIDTNYHTLGAAIGGKANNMLPEGIYTSLQGWDVMADNDRVYILNTESLLAIPLSVFHSAAEERAGTICDDSEYYDAWFSDYYMPIPRNGSYQLPDTYWMDRMTPSKSWEIALTQSDTYRKIIGAGSTIFLGGSNKVTALNAATGATVWETNVNGNARGLAVADGALFVSTDQGIIYRFENGATSPIHHTPSFSNPYTPDTALENYAAEAVAAAGRDKGLCLVLGAGDGQLAYEIAQVSDFVVVCFESNATKVATARANLRQAGVYGSQVVIRHETSNDPEYPDYFANVIVSADAADSGTVPYNPARILRMLQPNHGRIVFPTSIDTSAWTGEQLGTWVTDSGAQGGTWKTAARGRRPRVGTMKNGRGKGNRMNTDEALLDGFDNLKLQWFGDPYAQDVIDRHEIPNPPIYENGIMFKLGENDTVQAIDIYNGTTLWKIAVPGMARMAASHTAVPAVCNDGYVYITGTSNCVQIDAISGTITRTLYTPVAGTHWGYIGFAGTNLVGTCQASDADALFNPFGSLGDILESNFTGYKSTTTAGKKMVCIDPMSGDIVWTYTNGAIVNTTVTPAEDRIFFVESLNTGALYDADGLVQMYDLMTTSNGNPGPHLTALDAATGEILWTNKITRNVDVQYPWMTYLARQDNDLLLTRSYHAVTNGGSELYRMYDFEKISALDGSSDWVSWLIAGRAGEMGTLVNGKNSMAVRPIINKDRFYMVANFSSKDAAKDLYIYDFDTGDQLAADIDLGTNDKGCSPAIGSAKACFRRNYLHYIYDWETGGDRAATGTTRPSCWPSILPVGGLMVAPEASSGCSCGFPAQESFALAPDIPPEGPENSLPVATGVVAHVTANQSKTVVMTAEDADEDLLVFSTESQPEHGTVSGFNPDTGVIDYMPVHGFAGTDTFTYVASDGFGVSTTATITLKVSGTDTDGDGIPDDWEDANGMEFDNPNDANEDDDEDGHTNKQEYFSNTNPQTPDSLFVVSQTTYQPSGFEISWDAIAGVRYRLQYCEGDELGTGDFTDVVRPLSEELAPGAAGESVEMSWTDDFFLLGDPSSRGRIYRVRVVR